MAGVDWIILIVIAVVVGVAVSHGFFREAFGIAGLVVGYLLAAWRYQQVANWFSPYLKNEWLAQWLGFFAIFCLVLLAASLIGQLARWVMKEVGLSWFDRVLGGALGLLKASLIVAIFLVATTSFAPTSRWLADSSLAPYFLVFGRAAIWVAPSDLRSRFYQGLDLLHRGQQLPANVSAVTPGR